MRRGPVTHRTSHACSRILRPSNACPRTTPHLRPPSGHKHLEHIHLRHPASTRSLRWTARSEIHRENRGKRTATSLAWGFAVRSREAVRTRLLQCRPRSSYDTGGKSKPMESQRSLWPTIVVAGTSSAAIADYTVTQSSSQTMYAGHSITFDQPRSDWRGHRLRSPSFRPLMASSSRAQ